MEKQIKYVSNRVDELKVELIDLVKTGQFKKGDRLRVILNMRYDG